MQVIKKDYQIYYQQKKHHCQQLRHQIKPQTIDKLQINKNPSYISRKACQSLYYNQIQRQKQLKLCLEQPNNKQNYGDKKLPIIANKNKSISLIKSNQVKINENLVFKDYAQEKNIKIANHINLNYNKGADFYEASQQHEKLRQRQLKQMGQTLKTQIRQKSKEFQRKKSIKQIESKIRIQNILNLKLSTEKQRQKIQKTKQNLQKQYQKQIEELKIRNQSKKIFTYNNQARHNPITNPIEYHIDNPYILKQIQQNKLILQKTRNKI